IRLHGIEQRLLSLVLDLLPRAAVAAHAVLVEVDVRIRLGEDAPRAAPEPIGARRVIDDRHHVAVRRERRAVGPRRAQLERVALEVREPDRERVAGADLLDAAVAEPLAELSLREDALQDEALRGE